MALRIQNFSKKSFGPPQFTVSYPSGWTSNEQQFPQHLPKNIGFKVESPPQLFCEDKHLGHHSPDQESSSTLSIGQSHNEMGVAGGTISRDQCISSESGQDESCGKSVEQTMKPVCSLTSPDVVILNPPQVDYGQLMARGPYHYADPYFGGLFTAYGPQAVPQLGSQIVGVTAGRVPLPLDLTDGGPIFVNAKQYHGILRRRQSRAKLEAQNKLVKTRKPYLHESRHLHALNRVRGSGGRFLSSKKHQQPNPTLSSSICSIPDTIDLHTQTGPSKLESWPPGTTHSSALNTTRSHITTGDVQFRQPEHGFSGSISVHINGRMQSSGGLTCG